jgi:S-formylglutathione hydrolase
MAQSLQCLKEHASFGGITGFYSHVSHSCDGEMRFAVYQPPQAKSQPVPILYYLAGLTCTEETFMIKAGAQRIASELGILLVAPDTSPRNTGIPGEDDDWDLGTGAGFYVNATQDPWRQHYQMYSYVTDELPTLLAQHFPIRSDRQSIFGHSMGGHGALICALKNPQLYRSVSAFAPICAPLHCPWGQKAFSHYLGSDPETWRAWDACELIRSGHSTYSSILIDQGSEDPFLAQQQLLPERFAQACEEVGQRLTLRRQSGYDHSYYFISTLMEDHLRYHAEALGTG